MGMPDGSASWWLYPVGADVVVILAEWGEFAELNWQALAPVKRHPFGVVVAHASYNSEEVTAESFNMYQNFPQKHVKRISNCHIPLSLQQSARAIPLTEFFG